MSADRDPGGRTRRRRNWIPRPAVLAGVLAVWLAAGVRQVERGAEFGVVHGPLVPGPGVFVDGPVALAPIGIARLSRYPRPAVELPMPGAADAMLRGGDGGRYGFRGSATVVARPEDWRPLHRASAGDGLRGVLLEAVRAAGADLAPGAEAALASPAFARSLRERVREELDRRGVDLRRLELESLDRLTAAPGQRLPVADTRLLVVGLDGADWEILDPLIAQGRMPHLAGLIERGVRAKLLSISPMLSPVVWTTVATGVEPGRHGILDFLVEDTGGGPGQPVTSAQRQAATFWEMLSAVDVPVGVTGWWATWPAGPVNGYLVSDRIAYQLFGYRADLDDPVGKTWPPELYEEVVRPGIVDPGSVGWDELRAYLSGPREAELEFGGEERERLDEFRTLLASGRTYLGLLEALRERFPDTRLEVAYLEGTDTVGHLFMPFRPPRLPGIDRRGHESFADVVDRYYETADRQLGRLLEGRGEDWTVLLLSDHGFASDATRPQLTDSRIGHGAAADWHRRFGMFVLSGRHVRAGRRLDEASVYDIAPTVLALFGQPVPRSWPGQVLGGAIRPEFFERHPVRYVEADPPHGELRAGAGAETAADPAAEALLEKLRGLGYVAAGDDARTSVTAANNAGVALLAAGKFAEAEASFRAGLAEEPDSPTLLVNLANALRLQGRGDAARPHLERAFRYAATRRSAGHLLARLYLESGEPGRAERYLREVLRAEPEAAGVRTTLGALLEQRGELQAAEAEFRKAAATDPNAAQARNHLGNLARRRGRSDQAERWYTEAIAADPYFMGAYNNLALVYQDRGELERAMELYSRALTKAPNNAVVLNNLASLYHARGERDEAAALWRRALRVDPSYPSPYSNLASLELEAERYTEAGRLLRRALELAPDYGDARLNLALVHRARGDREAMRAELVRAAADPRSRPRALASLGFLDFEQGRIEGSIESLELARDAGVRDPALLNVLGECYRLLGRTREAAAAWDASLGLDPGQGELRERRAGLGAGS